MARASNATKIANHKKIVDFAGVQIRTLGLDGLNVSDAMKAAGLTHGGFYRHFRNKDQLLQEAIESAFANFLGKMESDLRAFGSEHAFVCFIDRYLSFEHVTNPGMGCPIATLSVDICRCSEDCKSTYSNAVHRFMAILEQMKPQTTSLGELDSASIIAFLSGTITLTRSLAASEEVEHRLSIARSVFL